MVHPLTPDEILAALQAWGISYIEDPGWRSRTNGTGWGDVTGFMVHHTGDDAPDTADLRVVRDGRVGLSGPLCQFGLRDDGRVHLVAAGAANHAGGGDQLVLDAVRQESYGDYPPAPRFTHQDRLDGVAGTASGNPVFYGVETFYFANLTTAARTTMPRLAAAIIWALDRKDTANSWTAKSVIGHKEWQRGKVDPAKVDMAVLRREVQTLLTNGPTTTEDDMTPDQAAEAHEVWRRLYATQQDVKAIKAALTALATGLPDATAKAVTDALSADYDATVQLTPKETP